MLSILKKSKFGIKSYFIPCLYLINMLPTCTPKQAMPYLSLLIQQQQQQLNTRQPSPQPQQQGEYTTYLAHLAARAAKLEPPTTGSSMLPSPPLPPTVTAAVVPRPAALVGSISRPSSSSLGSLAEAEAKEKASVCGDDCELVHDRDEAIAVSDR